MRRVFASACASDDKNFVCTNGAILDIRNHSIDAESSSVSFNRRRSIIIIIREWWTQHTSVAKVTNPKPRLRLVNRSTMTTESTTCPNCWKNSRNFPSVTAFHIERMRVVEVVRTRTLEVRCNTVCFTTFLSHHRWANHPQTACDCHARWEACAGMPSFQ